LSLNASFWRDRRVFVTSHTSFKGSGRRQSDPAVAEFVRRHPEFVVEQPAWPFNESELRTNVTHWPPGTCGGS
jgi:hypothetical protein